MPVLIGWGSPLAPVQILLLNLVTDGLPALALGMDAAEADIMRRRPRSSKEGIVNRYFLTVIGFNGLLFGISAVLSFWVGLQMGGLVVAETMTFVTLAFDELWRAYTWRSSRLNFWQINPWTNLYLVGAMLVSTVIILLTVLVGPLQSLFNTTTLSAVQWAVALAFSLVPLTAYEIWKLVLRLREKA